MISTFVARSKLRQIMNLMQEERVTLLNGPLSKLADIVQKRAAILDALENGGPVARTVLNDGLAQIRNLATRNKKLFEASIDGMKLATTSLETLENNIGAMETYNSGGQKVVVLQKTHGKDHRV